MDSFKSSRLITDMHPRLQSLYARFEFLCADAGISFVRTCTYRNDIDQSALYEQGRSKPGLPIVTNADAGESPHNTLLHGRPASCAFDIAILKNGKIDWDVKNPDWKRAGNIGMTIGLEWGGFFVSRPDMPHFQLTDWRKV